MWTVSSVCAAYLFAVSVRAHVVFDTEDGDDERRGCSIFLVVPQVLPLVQGHIRTLDDGPQRCGRL